MIRDAATVVLMRDGERGPEVYLLHRVRSMAFAAGMYVFPGGTVDPADYETEVGPLADWPERLHADPQLATALLSAAIRETFEETGVLVASTLGADPSWESDRVALLGHDSSLAQVLRRRGARVVPEALRAWSHWITPTGEPRRYDTRFLVAAMPPGQEARWVGGEARDARWIRPADAGALPMLPPTRVTLGELAAYGSVAAVLDAAADRRPEPILPVRHGDRVELPDGRVIVDA